MTTTGPARSTRARPTDDELLDSARAVFVERGFRATTMNAIAERGNSTKPTLYAHFGDKDSLYVRLLQREADTCRSRLFTAYAANAELGLHPQVAADTQAFFDYATAEPDGFQLLFGVDITRDSIAVREQLVAEVDEQIASRVHGYLSARGLHACVDEAQLAVMLVGVAVSAARNAIERGSDLVGAARLASAFSSAALANLEIA